MATRRVQSVQPIQGAAIRSEEAKGRFTLDEVTALVGVIAGTQVTCLRWDRHGQRVVIHRGQPAPITQIVQHAPNLAVSVPAARPPTPVEQLTPGGAPPAVPKPDLNPGVIVTSPFVGTFYRAPSFDSRPFVEVGTVVEKGQVLGIVEAMKLMNEIEAEAPGTVAELLVANATPVEYGQPLFRIDLT